LCIVLNPDDTYEVPAAEPRFDLLVLHYTKLVILYEGMYLIYPAFKVQQPVYIKYHTMHTHPLLADTIQLQEISCAQGSYHRCVARGLTNASYLFFLKCQSMDSNPLNRKCHCYMTPSCQQEIASRGHCLQTRGKYGK